MTRQWCIRALLAMAVCVAFAFLGATYGEAAAPGPPRVVAAVGAPGGTRLGLVDARTLEPVRGGWSSQVIDYETRPTLSPSRARVVFAALDGVLVVLDTATGRVVRTYGKWAKGGEQLYWLGGEGTKSDPRSWSLISASGHASGAGVNMIDRRDPGSAPASSGASRPPPCGKASCSSPTDGRSGWSSTG